MSLSDYSCAGVTFQWQASTDSAVWSNIAGANLPTFVIAPTASLYYRCVVTCTSSGMIAYSGSVFIRGGLGFNSAIINNPDTTCNEPKFYISVCIFSPSYKVVSYYGDGTSDTTHLTDTAICQAEFYHNYTTSGTYFIKQVLYDSSEAVDSVSFSYQYLYCRFLPLKFYSDLNHNCVFDSGDIYNMLPINVEVDSNHIPIDTISVTTGVYYKTNGGVGTIYSFRVLSSELYVSCPGSGIVYDTIQSYINNYAIKNIGLSCVTGTAYDLGISASLLCGVHMAVGDIVVFNSYCEAENAIVSMPINPKYRFSSSSPAPTSVVGNTATWDFSLLSAASLESVIHFSLTIPTSAYLTIGDTVQSSYAVTPVTSDVNPANNNCVILDTVKGSFDPNEMSVTPSGYISAGTQLKYTILFENTGNDTAHDIYVMDTLSDNVDLHSLKLLAATAAMNIAAFNDGAHNIVKFDFPGINLLDSTHHNLCDGMVMVNINAKPGLPDGTLIFNHAGIFFDDNPVVMTDTVEDIIGSPILGTTVISNNEVELFPNPTTSELVIKMQQGAYSSCTITNAIGQVDLQQQISVAQTKMNVKMLPAGVYYIILRGNNGSKMLKFVKE